MAIRDGYTYCNTVEEILRAAARHKTIFKAIQNESCQMIEEFAAHLGHTKS